MKKVDLVVYEDGKRKVIGEAVVDIADGYLDVSGLVTDSHYKSRITEGAPFSVTFSSLHDEVSRTMCDAREVSLDPAPFKAQIPNS